MRVFALMCLMALMASTVAMGADVGLRDVLAGVWDHPLVTDADVVRYVTDTRAVLDSDGGRVLIRYPGITGVVIGDAPVEVASVGEDLLAVELPAGVNEIAVLTGGAPPEGARPADPVDPVADSPERFAELAGALGPGDELVIADGIYRDWRVVIDAEGTADRPIVVRPETPGGAIFRGNVRFVVTGDHVVLRGLRFEHCGPGTTVHLEGASDCRVTQCQFFYCGNPTSTFGHIVRVDMESHRNRVDNCFFLGSKSMGIGQRISGDYEVPVGTDNSYDRNIFRDVFRYWINGQENIQLGQNQRDFGDREPRALVEGNLFDHAWGDSEIISSKSSRNVVRYNTAAHCRQSAFVLRGGDYARFEGNVVYNCNGGVRVMGTNHEIVNNLLLNNHSYGVNLQTGTAVGQMQVAADDTLVAHNTIVGSPQGIHALAPSETRPHVPKRCRIINNLIANAGGTLMDTAVLEDELIRRNLLWGGGVAEIGEAGDEAIIEEPGLIGEGASLRPSAESPAIDAALPIPEVTHDRLGRTRPHGDGPDIGAEEVGAQEPELAVVLPPIPPEPLIEPGLYLGAALHRQDPEAPLAGWRIEGEASTDGETALLEDARATVGEALPAELLVQWSWRPAAWASAGTLALEGPGGAGWSLSWGGETDEGRPRCLIELRDGSGELLATGSDIVYYAGDFRAGYGDNRGPDEPLEDRWYEFTLLLRRDSLVLLLTGSTARVPTPVMVWNTHGEAVGGPLELSLRQDGSGWWRDLSVSAVEYTGDREPETPPNLQARAHGGGRVELTWGEPTWPARGFSHEIHRSTEAGFTPSAATVVALGVLGVAWDDFAVEPNTTYHYAVRARNVLGLSSGFASVEARTGEGGPRYMLLRARELDEVASPMVLTVVAAGEEPGAFIWAPGAAFSTQAPPDEGVARFRFTLGEAANFSIWGLVLAPSGASDSFYVAVDDGPFGTWYTGIHASWSWSPIARNVELDAGEHSISFRHREPETRLAAVLITDDSAWEPGDR
ncbi:MAG: chondroitinase-B domain-containing protein [Armatimonadota bacterium]|jgi:poly(beta-D-mannuronate) lyase